MGSFRVPREPTWLMTPKLDNQQYYSAERLGHWDYTRISEYTSRGWPHSGIRVRALNMKRARTRGRRRRCHFFLFPSRQSRSLIVFRSSIHINRCTHHEHLRSRGSRLGFVYHLSLLRWKWLFEDSGGPFEQVTNFISLGTILSVVIFLTNEARILRFPLPRSSRWFGRTLFRGIDFSFVFAFLLPFRGFVRCGRPDNMDLKGFTRARWILGWTIRNNIWDRLLFGSRFSRALGYWIDNSINGRNT